MATNRETATTFPQLTGMSATRADVNRWPKAIADIREGLERWQMWWLLGLNDIRQRYRRSRLGQLWITLSMAVFIVALGIVYSALFRMDMQEYLPFLTVNMVVWSLISTILNEGCTVFTSAESYLRQERIPKTVFIMRLVVRNVLILGHNAVLIPAVFLFFKLGVSWTALLAIPGLLIVLVNGFLAALFLGIVCTRFRDLPQMVGNIVQIAFFLSPIMWHKKLVIDHHTYLVTLNPFASHLMVVSEPLLGQVPEPGQYLMCLASTAVLAILVVPFFARFRERIVYWL